MSFLSFENYTFKTRLSKQQISEELKGFAQRKSYEGQWSGTEFVMLKVIGWKKDYSLPSVRVRVLEKPEETIVQVQIKQSFLVPIWCGITIFAFAGMLTRSVYLAKFDPLMFVPLGMFLFVYALGKGIFMYQNDSVKKEFVKMFGEPVEGEAQIN